MVRGGRKYAFNSPKIRFPPPPFRNIFSLGRGRNVLLLINRFANKNLSFRAGHPDGERDEREDEEQDPLVIPTASVVESSIIENDCIFDSIGSSPPILLGGESRDADEAPQDMARGETG
jgi:hypothetical protein